MLCRVMKPFSRRGDVQLLGSIIEVPEDAFKILAEYVVQINETGKDLPHYCTDGDCWCSAKLPGSDYPTGCINIGCEYHRREL